MGVLKTEAHETGSIRNTIKAVPLNEIISILAEDEEGGVFHREIEEKEKRKKEERKERLCSFYVYVSLSPLSSLPLSPTLSLSLSPTLPLSFLPVYLLSRSVVLMSLNWHGTVIASLNYFILLKLGDGLVLLYN